METERIIEVRDARKRQMFKVDDLYIDRYARLCGVNATAVYMSLCRHASGTQESHPSIRLIMQQHGFGSHHTVIKALRKLAEFGIIQITKRRDAKNKRQMVNVYMLTDISSWKPMAPNAIGADGISDTDPMAFHAQKPMAPNATEGYTEEKDTQRRVVALGATVSASTQKQCGYGNGNECKQDPIKGKYLCKMHQPMNADEFVEWYRKSEKRYIRLIAEFADEVKPKTCETVAQWEAWAACHYRAAQKIAPFSDDQIAVGIERVKAAKYLTSWNLETLLKFIVNVEVKQST